MNASDADSGSFGEVSYTIPSEIQKSVHLDPLTGILKAKVAFNREVYSVLSFDVTALDAGDPAHAATARVVIRIKDVNDEAPTFSKESYSLSVHENQPRGATVGRVMAKDADTAEYGDFSYSFFPTSTHVDKFFIHPKTGEINTTRRLDRESQDVYYLVVRASDHQSPPLSSTASLTVYVEDENDNTPQFDFPTQSNHTVNVSSNTPMDFVVTKLRAHDMDVGENARLTYTLISGNERGLFRLEETTGAVFVNSALTRLRMEQFRFRVRAMDAGTPTRTATATLSLVVNASLPFLRQRADGGAASGRSSPNLTIVVSLACISALVILILLLAIVIVAIRRREEERKVHKYNCRMEALRMLTAKETMSGDDTGPSSGNDKRLSNGSVLSTTSDKPRKEVSFSLDTEDTTLPEASPLSPEARIQRSWPCSPDDVVSLHFQYIQHLPLTSKQDTLKQ